MTAGRLSIEQRQEIFHALVVTQDTTSSVADSRKIVGDKFNITEDQVRSIENEGIENEWPPLGESA